MLLERVLVVIVHKCGCNIQSWPFVADPFGVVVPDLSDAERSSAFVLFASVVLSGVGAQRVAGLLCLFACGAEKKVAKPLTS